MKTTLTKEDLQRTEENILREIVILKHALSDFKTELDFLKEQLSKNKKEIDYFKSKDVKRILGCSDSKLEGLRKKGILIPSATIGSTHYYKQSDVNKLFCLN